MLVGVRGMVLVGAINYKIPIIVGINQESIRNRPVVISH